jgi:hypothetical protein
MRSTRLTAALFAATMLVAAGAARADEEHHAGYYYPKPTSTETYKARVETLAGATRAQRIAFVTGVTQQLMNGKFEPGYAIFAKGDDADEMIIVAVEDGEINTVYRARALLANLTALSRLTPFFRDNTVADQATFFDLCKLLGFTQVTVSDGDKFAMQVKVE